MPRILIVSNRLPVTVRRDAGALHLVESAGGLASGLRSCHDDGDGLWFGWPEHVGRINGRFGSASALPVHYLHQSLSREDLVALYSAADIMLVTPIRDGMNLVAKEFIASRVDDEGVLVLSEFAGAACELREALLVNPYDIDGVFRAVQRALAMDVAERHARMRALREQVASHDLHRWTAACLAAIAGANRQMLPLAPNAASVTPLPETPRSLRRLTLLRGATADAGPHRATRMDDADTGIAATVGYAARDDFRVS